MREDIAFALRSVVGSTDRLRALFAHGPRTPIRLVRFLRTIVPLAAAELATLRDIAEAIPDARMREEALASIDGKAFHVAGAAILATFLPREDARAFVRIVTPLETIYDYLDNLCDRHPDVAPDAYPVLHHALADALDPHVPPRDYYARGPLGDDGGYLRLLVERTQRALAAVPGFERLAPLLSEAASFYAELQTNKHLPRGRREIVCVEWYDRHRARFHELDWHEFACACGSNMQVFGVLFAAFRGHGSTEIAATYDAYFPFVCALHIMLDSFIDRDEDREHDDLNFVDVYPNARALRDRLVVLTQAARERIAPLADASEHRFVLDVMTLFYLSHPKVAAQGLEREAREVLRANGNGKGGPDR